MIQKPEQYYDTRRHQLYYQWRESEYFSHQEPIYDRTREYIESLEAEHAKLLELAARMAEALGIDCEWADPDWCKSPCALEFGCWPIEEHTEIQCPAWAAMHELGVEVDE